MNSFNIMNNKNFSSGALERALAARLRELLGGVSWLRDWDVSQNPAPFGRAFDILAKVPLPTGNTVELWVECRDLPRPSLFPYVCLTNRFHEGGKRTTRVPVLAAPWITGRMADLCTEHGWSWFDLAGNCRLDVPQGFYIERSGHDPVHHRPRPSANLGTAESGRTLRALLAPQNVGRRWTQRELQCACQPGVSLGLVNKVVRHLRDEAFIEVQEDGGFRLLDPLKLLFAWRDAYRFDRHERRGYFTLLRGEKLRAALAGLKLTPGGHVAYAAFSAAEFQAPHVRQTKTWLYLSASLEDAFCSQMEAKPVDSGENLAVLIPEDEGVFYLADGGAVGDRRIPCTNAVQTYVDLSHCGERGEEAAEALLEQRLKSEWKRDPRDV
ncbi:MAG TPA: type IV toxin-antitoxin system AbiEi family antitoxin [Verrucomicrobiae bacterium]|nr:type IV toxin-antitoxin system AbiEi family antitoxin [Verrucomicrobiae bacterium]